MPLSCVFITQVEKVTKSSVVSHSADRKVLPKAGGTFNRSHFNVLFLRIRHFVYDWMRCTALFVTRDRSNMLSIPHCTTCILSFLLRMSANLSVSHSFFPYLSLCHPYSLFLSIPLILPIILKEHSPQS